jgi:hypothetical protein
MAISLALPAALWLCSPPIDYTTLHYTLLYTPPPPPQTHPHATPLPAGVHAAHAPWSWPCGPVPRAGRLASNGHLVCACLSASQTLGLGSQVSHTARPLSCSRYSLSLSLLLLRECHVLKQAGSRHAECAHACVRESESVCVSACTCGGMVLVSIILVLVLVWSGPGPVRFMSVQAPCPCCAAAGDDRTLAAGIRRQDRSVRKLTPIPSHLIT